MLQLYITPDISCGLVTSVPSGPVQSGPVWSVLVYERSSLLYDNPEIEQFMSSSLSEILSVKKKKEWARSLQTNRDLSGVVLRVQLPQSRNVKFVMILSQPYRLINGE